MAKLVFLMLLAGGGWWAWQNDRIPLPAAFEGKSPAFTTYERFAKLMATDDYGPARRLAAKAAVRSIQVRELRGRRNTTLGVSGKRLTKDERKQNALGEVIGISHDTISEMESADGNTVAIQAVQRVCRNRSGCQEARHEVEMCLTEGEWKVCSFRESSV